MEISTNSPRYNSVAVFLHWTIAILIIVMLIVGLTMDGYPISIRFIAYNLHKSTGLTILGLSLFRLYWRLTHKPPPLPAHMPRWQVFAADFTHWAFYAFIILMPLSGWVMVSAAAKFPTVFFWVAEVPPFPLPAALNTHEAHERFAHVHAWLGYGIIALLAVHVGAALQHHFIDRDSVLRRMLPMWLQRRGKAIL